MSFKIVNSHTQQSISMKELDADAATLWGREIDPKYYAAPTDTGNNWFDTIGWNIHCPSTKYTRGWDNVKCSLMVVHTASFGTISFEQQIEKLPGIQAYLNPYFALIDHWQMKGYEPVRVDD